VHEAPDLINERQFQVSNNNNYQKREPILQINIQMRNKTEVIDVYEGQEAREVALDFVS
jgi:hypothetical protein